MAKIIWKGFTEHSVPAPRQPLPPDAHPLLVPRQHYWLKAILLAAPVYLPVLASLYLKSYLLHTDMRDKLWIVIGMALTLLLGVVHECLHAWVYPRNATAHIGVLYKRFLVLYGLRSAYPPKPLFRHVPATHAALYHPLDYLPALPSRCQNIGFIMLGMRHHVCRGAVSRLYERLVRMATSAQ